MISAPPPPLMTCEQLAQRLNVSLRFVRRLVDQRRVPFLKIGKFVRFDPGQIERWISSQPTGPRQPIPRGGRP